MAGRPGRPGADQVAERGPITERRFALKSGQEVELGIGQPAWASVTPIDDGTRRVATDGMRAIYDPDGLLAKLQHAWGRPG